MFCTQCGTALHEQDNFCSHCGAATARGASAPTWTKPVERLSRPMSEAKVAGVCAAFARYFGLDVTLIRVLWVILTVFPLPFFGVVSYIVAWIVMPKDPVTVPARVTVAN